jgi:uncharacterized protein (TIGR02453 family)
MLQPSTIHFLKQLNKNNNKPWFDANRKIYEAAKADFASFIQQVIDQYGKTDPSVSHLAAKECMFRINRDVRFSKDKSPYKNNFVASIEKGGKKAVSSAGYYFHLQPGQAFTGGGIWMPQAEDLKKVRQEIDYNLTDFKKIIAAKAFKTVYGNLSQEAEYKLSRVPKGYEADNPAAEYIKLKSFIAMVRIDDSILTSKDLIKKTIGAFNALRPLIEFINTSIEA